MKSDPAEGTSKKNSGAKEAASPSRRGPILLIVAVVLVIGLIFGLKAFFYGQGHESTDDAQVDADLIAVTSKISERVADIPVRTNTFVHRGQVLVVLDDRDERRRLTQAIAVLNANRAQAEAASANVSLTTDQQNAQVEQGNGGVAQALAGVQSAREQLAQAVAETRVADANVATARAQLDSAHALASGTAATLARTNADLRRAENLARTGDEPTSELDAARAAQANAVAQDQQARANITVAEATLASALDRLQAQHSAVAAAQANVVMQSAAVTTAEGKRSEAASPYRITTENSSRGASLAQVATQEAAVALARDQLSYTVIRAPIDGYIGEKDVQVGKTVAPGETLLTVVPAQGLFITANYKETQVGRIRPGQPVDITVDAYGSREFHGHVETMPPASQATYSLIPAQNSTGNFVKVTQRLPVRIAVDSGIDDAHQLRVGMSVETAVSVK